MENGKSRLQRAQDEVEEVTVILLDNWKKAKERDGNLEDLEKQAEELQQQAKKFDKLTSKVKEKYAKGSKEPKNRNVKPVVVMVVAVLIIIVLIIILLATGVIPNSSPLHPTVTPTSKP